MIILIKGVQFRNQGAHLMLLAVRERLAGILPEARIALAPGPNSPYRQRARLDTLQILPLSWRGLDLNGLSACSPPALRSFGHRYGIVTECEVDAVLDASGFAYGDPWPARLMHYAAGEVLRLARRGRPYLFLPQAFGPFGRAGWARRRFAAALHAAAVVCPRDPESRAHLLTLAPELKGALPVIPDFTLGLAGDAAAARRWGVGCGTVLLIPNSQMVGERNASRESRARYGETMVVLGRAALRRGYDVRVLNHSGADDRPLCARLARELGGSPVIEEDCPLATKGVIGAAAAVVSSRFHGCVSAMSQAVPCLGTTWSHKYAALFEDFDMSEWLAADAVPAGALGRFERLLAMREPLAARLIARRPTLEARVEEMWMQVATALSAQGRSGGASALTANPSRS